MLRRLVPVTAAAGLLLAGLTGCSTQQALAADCEPTFQPGILSDTVTVENSFGESPEVTIPDDVSITTTQRTVVGESGNDGMPAMDQTLVGVNMAFFEASTGEKLYQSPGFETPGGSPEFILLSDEAANPLSETARCTVPGDRVVFALGPDESAQLASQLGGAGDSAIVGVMDVTSTSPMAAQGNARSLPNGFPAVVTNDEGQPGIVLPPNNAPAGITSAVRVEGDGDEVTAEDNVIGHVLIVDWAGNQSMNSWDTGLMSMGTEAQIAESGYAFRGELTGAKIGSQVVVIVNEGEAEAQVAVVDVLGVN